MKYNSLILTLGILLISLSGCKQDCSDPNINVSETQLAEDIAAIDAYLAEEGIDAEVHPSGIRYVIKREGDGDRPDACAQVFVTYEGRLISNGNVFDGRTSPTALDLDTVIPGWRIGIPLIKDGGRISLYIPSVLAYGSSGTVGVPEDANLYFEVLIFDVR
ncbi:MAG: hypothetical protein ED557_05605 [Balneola sp.]|nr:MAG: hypothetical protein ED557_05605 [Balneola sp.]